VSTSKNPKELLVGTTVGKIAFSLREAIARLKAPVEQIPWMLNDSLARRILIRLCQPGRTFIDVGAHIGSVIADVQRHSPEAKIVAIEAIPDKAEALRRKFPRVEIQCCALAETEGTASFFVGDQSGYSSLDNVGGKEIAVRTRPLDAVITAPDVDVIKIDVVGAELGVLIGAEQTIARCRPTIVFESGPQEVLGYTKERMFDWLDARDYRLFVPNRLPERDGGPGLNKGAWLDCHFYPWPTLNYFAVPAERLATVRKRARSLTR
jgi:FkbM family methyltransferase